jgi:hypothetical protein
MLNKHDNATGTDQAVAATLSEEIRGRPGLPSGAKRGTSVGEWSVRMRARRTALAPAAGAVAGDVDADFHRQLGAYERDVQRLPRAPAGGERPARPRVIPPPRYEQAGERRAGCLGGVGAPTYWNIPSVSYLLSNSVRGAARDR